MSRTGALECMISMIITKKKQMLKRNQIKGFSVLMGKK